MAEPSTSDNVVPNPSLSTPEQQDPEGEALKKLMEGTVSEIRDTELVIVNTDWKLETMGVKTFGMCFVRVSPPYDHMNFKRGFSLPNPSHPRCAIFAMILGAETVDSIEVGTERPRYVIATKNKWLHSVIANGALDRWCNTNKWPGGVAHMKGLLIRLRDVLSELPERSHIVCIERDKNDPAEIDLETKDDDVDAEKIMQKGGGQEAIQKALRDMRMKNTMVQELIASGARGSRPKKKMPEQKKKGASVKESQVKEERRKKQEEYIKSISKNIDGTSTTATSADTAGPVGGPGAEVRPTEANGNDAPVS